jgi:hypothetical protein
LRVRTPAGLCRILASCAQFAFVTIFPIFVTPDYPPFGSTLVQFFSSGFLVFIGSPYGNTYFLPTAKRANPMLPELQPVRKYITKAAGAAAQAWSQIIVPNLTVCMTVPVAAVVYIGSCQGPQTSTVATVVHL